MEKYKKIIESPKSWKLAKHRAASALLKKANSNKYVRAEVREYLWNQFVKTKDYYYCAILK